MLKNLLFLCLFCTIFPAFQSLPHVNPTTHYNAAVVEHQHVRESCTAITDKWRWARCIKDENLAIYAGKVMEAERLGAQIIVFPEEGIRGKNPRPIIPAFSEDIPSPTDGDWCPYQDPILNETHYTNYKLSSLAKKSGMYVIANVVDYKNRSSRIPGNYYYNTEVAYNPNGCLVAKYHKYNLYNWERQTYNRPDRVEYSYFDTQFGRFGLFVCFDVLFSAPAYNLVERYDITDIAYSTAWIDLLPMYSAVGIHSGYAQRMRVNFLASNFRQPVSERLGSGIYTPNGPLSWYRNYTSKGSHLVVANVPINKKSRVSSHPLRFQPKSSTDTSRQKYAIFQSDLFFDTYNFTPLTTGKGTRKVCMNNFCCQLDYNAQIPDSELFAFGVFKGLHFTPKYQQCLHMENCILTVCATKDPKTCGSTAWISQAKFNYVKISAKYSAKYVFPQVITNQIQLAKLEEYTTNLDEGSLMYLESTRGISEPVVFAGLYGRIDDVTCPQ